MQSAFKKQREHIAVALAAIAFAIPAFAETANVSVYGRIGCIL